MSTICEGTKVEPHQLFLSSRVLGPTNIVSLVFLCQLRVSLLSSSFCFLCLFFLFLFLFLFLAEFKKWPAIDILAID